MSLVRFRPEAPDPTVPESMQFDSDSRQDAGVAHPVERHLAKVEVASSSLVTRSKQIRNAALRSLFHMVPWPSGKAKVCKTFIRQFKSGRYLQKSASFDRRLPILLVTYSLFTLHYNLVADFWEVMGNSE